MLIDNKIDYTAIGELPGSGVKTVLDFIRKYTGLESGRKGDLDVVTGFFTIAGLDLLYKELAPDTKYRLVLSELAGDDDFMFRVINLLHGDLGIEATLKLRKAEQNAIAFLRRETVEVRAISSAFCHAKAYDQNLSAPFFDPEWMFGIKDGFDVVIGNPPYVSTKGRSDEDKAALENEYGFADDLYYHFIIRGSF